MDTVRALFYLTYAGWYGHFDGYTWVSHDFTYGAFTYHGHDLDAALAHLAELQQHSYDFVGLTRHA